MRFLDKLVKNSLKGVGIHVSRIVKQPTPLAYHGIELLLDVGANIGQYAMSTRLEGYRGTIVSFEPLPDAYETLTDNSRKDTLWTVHPRCAVGSKPGVAEINISKDSYASSLLPILQTHIAAAPNSVFIGKAKTDVITLDSVFDSYRKNAEKTFLKIDTQGFEAEVLEGLSKNIQNIFSVQLELSIVPLYDNQALYPYVFTFFEQHGFLLWSLIPGTANTSTGQLLQFDAVFDRSN
jgi:FkbM family methyltransferase